MKEDETRAELFADEAKTYVQEQNRTHPSCDTNPSEWIWVSQQMIPAKPLTHLFILAQTGEPRELKTDSDSHWRTNSGAMR